MKTRGQVMGRFLVEIEIVNYDDVVETRNGRLDPGKIRRRKIDGVVDSGASRLVLPQSVAKELGLPIRASKTRVKYADGRRAVRQEVESAQVHLQGRDGVFTAVVEPKRDTALIGAIVLEDLDFLIDPKKSCLVPRDPHYVLSELE